MKIKKKEAKDLDYWGKKETLGIILVLFMLSIMLVSSKDVHCDEINTVYVDELYDPTLVEAICFMVNDTTDQKEGHLDGPDRYACLNFSLDTINNAEKFGIRCYLVIVYNTSYEGMNHAIIAFNTIDHGLVYFEPQTDNIVSPRHMDIWE